MLEPASPEQEPADVEGDHDQVGRRPKVYEPSDLELGITIPQRHYELVGELLVDALTQATPGEAPLAAATRIATAKGRQLGTQLRLTRALGRLGPERTLTAAGELLEQYGYEPRRPSPHTLRLDNCPFHVPRPDACCVELQAPGPPR